MIAVVDIGLRASLVVLVALAASAALRRRSPALRYSVLAAGILCAATVAPLGRALPPWNVTPRTATPIELALATLAKPVPPYAPASVTTTVAPKPSAAVQGGMSFEVTLNALWALGAAVAALAMGLSFAGLARVRKSATPLTDPRWTEPVDRLRQLLDVRDHVAVLRSNRPGLVGTYGWRRPRVLLPPECDSWSDERIRIVLGHELAHIRRGDWIVQIAAEAVRAAFWYNPLFWIACARLRSASEQACDDAVLEAGVPAADYAAHLLAIARTGRPQFGDGAVVPMARRSTLERRITAMLNTTIVHRRPSRRAFTLVFVAIAGLTLAAASFRASAQTQPRALTGTVYDMTGSVLPQATVTLADGAGLQQSAATDRYGRFDLGVVAPGRYLLTTTLIGFSPIMQEISLQEARHWDRPITLHVGTLQEAVTVIDRRPASAPPQVTTAPPIGGNLRTPAKTADVRPAYPQALRDAGVEGVVPLGAVIGKDGIVASVRVLTSRAHPDLASAAVDAVRQWRFRPTLLNGEAIEVYMTVTVRFSLVE